MLGLPQARVHRRVRDQHEDDAPLRPQSVLGALHRLRPPWTLAHQHLHRSAAARPDRRTDPFRRADERGHFPSIRRADTRPDPRSRRYRYLRQPIQPQKFGSAGRPAGSRSRYRLPAAIQSGYESDRDGLFQNQSLPERSPVRVVRSNRTKIGRVIGLLLGNNLFEPPYSREIYIYLNAECSSPRRD